MEIKVIESKENNFLMCLSQSAPHPAFIEFDLRSGEIWSGLSPDIGGVVYGHVGVRDAYRWQIPSDLTTASINDVLEDVAKLPALKKAISFYHEGEKEEALDMLESVNWWFERNQSKYRNMQRMQHLTWSEWFENIDIFTEMQKYSSIDELIKHQDECELGDEYELVDFIVSEIKNAEDHIDLPAYALEIEEIADAFMEREWIENS